MLKFLFRGLFLSMSFSRTRKINQFEQCIKYIPCSDWTILKYECENHSLEFYDRMANCHAFFKAYLY